MKRFLALALLFGLFASLAGCEGGGGGEPPKQEGEKTTGATE